MAALGCGWGDGRGSGKGWQEALLCELPRILSQQSRNLHTQWFPHQLLSFWNQEKKRAGRAAEAFDPLQCLSARASVPES